MEWLQDVISRSGGSAAVLPVIYGWDSIFVTSTRR